MYSESLFFPRCSDAGILVKDIEELPHDFLYNIGLTNKNISEWNSEERILYHQGDFILIKKCEDCYELDIVNQYIPIKKLSPQRMRQMLNVFFECGVEIYNNGGWLDDEPCLMEFPEKFPIKSNGENVVFNDEIQE